MAVAEKLDTKVERGPWKWALYTRAETMQSIPAFLWALKDMGGVCADKSGRAPAKVFAHAEKMGTPLHPRSAPSAMLRELENGTYAGAIKRTKGSRQTYRIELLLTDEQMPPKPFPVKTTKVEPERVAVTEKPKADGGTGPRPADPTPEPKPHPGPPPSKRRPINVVHRGRPGYSRDSRSSNLVRPWGTISQSIAVTGRPVGTASSPLCHRLE